jgi:proline dehydrogenase
VLKNLFLSLSTNQSLRRWAETSALARRLSARFIAGNELADGLAVIRQLKRNGILTALDHLGENVTTEAEANAAAKDALRALEAAAAENADATVSIKLTQFGLDLSNELTFQNVLPLVRRAADLRSRIEVDMESTVYTQRTIDMLLRMHEQGPVRAVIQAYLYRTEQDIRLLNERKIPVRLCKGAYNEPPELAMKEKRDVDANFKKIASLLLAEGTLPAFATHDPRMIEHVLAQKPSPGQIEFQMLYGIGRDLQKMLRDQGWSLRLYVPYGGAWYPYFMRRLAERPANVWFVARSLIR